MTQINDDALHGTIVGSGDFKYRINTEWGKLDTTRYPVENCHDFAIDSQGRIVMLTDDTRNNLIFYSKEGEVLDAWGTEFPGAHAIEIRNENGQDFIYLVDSGWKLNRNWDGVSTDAWDSPHNKVIAQSGFVVKMTIDGQLIYTIGHPQTVGAYRPDQPFRPTDIAIADNGDLYITDGYGSDYLLQYNAQGQFIRKWGGQDNADAHYNLVNTHGVTIDRRDEKNPILLVSSRFENAIKQFSLTGEYLGTIPAPGAYLGGPIFYGKHFFAPVCWSHVNDTNAKDSGFISIFDENNRMIANLGGTEPEYVDGELQPVQTTWDIFKHCHGICVDEVGNVYVGQWRADNSYPYKLEKL